MVIEKGSCQRSVAFNWSRQSFTEESWD